MPCSQSSAHADKCSDGSATGINECPLDSAGNGIVCPEVAAGGVCMAGGKSQLSLATESVWRSDCIWAVHLACLHWPYLVTVGTISTNDTDQQDTNVVCTCALHVAEDASVNTAVCC